MPPFRPLTDVQLAALDDDAIIAHIRAARAAGDRAAATLAVRVLVFGYLGIVRARVALKVPREDVELVAGTAFESAFKAAFRGESVGEFRSWLNTIVDRRVADYHRARERRPGVVPLAEELAEGEGLGVRLAVAPEQEAVDAQSAVNQALAELSPPPPRGRAERLGPT